MAEVVDKPVKAEQKVGFSLDKMNKFFPGTLPSQWKKHGTGYKHDTASLALNVIVGEGTMLGPGACVCDGTVIGENCIVGGSSRVQYHVKISDNVHIGEMTYVGSYSVVAKNCEIGNSVCIKDKSILAEGSYVGDGKSVKGMYDLPKPVPARTQKARGIAALMQNGFSTPDFETIPIEHFSSKPANADRLINKFVRPCPVTPRHGFVDSRPVKTPKEALQIIKESQEADPKSEILTMPFIKSDYSGIWTTGSLTIGPGNDGATSGHKSITVPVLGTPKQGERWKKVLTDAGITESPYMEILWEPVDGELNEMGHAERYSVRYVQLRNGPQIPACSDYIPARMRVKHVVEAGGSLLEWEQKVKDFKPGTVVYHPDGNLASHYAVHAFLSKIPVVTSRKPEVGELLVKTKESANEPDVVKIKSGFIAGCRMDVTYPTAARVMLAGCHSTTQWLGVRDEWMGLALGFAYRLILTAALGEARHKPKTRSLLDRAEVYKAVWTRALRKGTVGRYLKALHSFEFDNWSGSYGGCKWLELSRWAGRIFNAVLAGDVKKAMESLNGGVHSVHNGGWAFNKFIGETELNEAAISPLIPVIKIAPVLYSSYRMDTTYLSKWWEGRTAIKCEEGDNKDGPLNPDDEPAGAHKGTEPCGCDKHNCKKCYPDEYACDCSSHTCTDCYPKGCACASKMCHDCNVCAFCFDRIMNKAKTKSSSVPIETGMAQAKIIHSSGNTYLHVQFKKHGSPHKSINIPLPSSEAAYAKEKYEDGKNTYADSWATPKLCKYIPLKYSGLNQWALGELVVDVYNGWVVPKVPLPVGPSTAPSTWFPTITEGVFIKPKAKVNSAPNLPYVYYPGVLVPTEDDMIPVQFNSNNLDPKPASEEI